ncbi:hypothetical protein WOLCODRAFT_132222 [Wolfiporia cocos MD-104 SS10]|uniref:Uncharacterized protein n=1 Tax=Wolfiporia cocos (strain MD-104) TaxID=742152 RepID=A0A2H3K161_WOLCO|nr:hypothetical protein WOLCODRAFT_132222 [Wolfiporia cocos MD-104 SS10]
MLESLSRHTLRQLKFILPGGLITYYLNSHIVFWNIVNGDVSVASWGRLVALTSLGSAMLTIALFMYILSHFRTEGQPPDYRRWRESGVLSSVIPILTASIVVGWSLLSYTLSYWSDLGFIEGVIAASGLYALAFGIMGLISGPKVSRR